MKKCLSIFLAGLLLLAVTGCGGDPGAVSSTPIVSGDTVDASTTTTAAQAASTSDIQSGDSTTTGGKTTTMSNTSDKNSTAKTTVTTKTTKTTKTTATTVPIDTSKAIEVKTNKSKRLYTSHMKLGTTQTHYHWESGNAVASMSAAKLLRNVSSINNQHIVAFGASYLQESQGAKLNFTSLDNMMDRLEMLKGDNMLTLCSAPGWMLVSNPSDKYDAESRPKEEYFDEYADICAQVAARYTQVDKFQVWNELKGFWNQSRQWFDYQLYTEFYNKIYDAVKKVRPDAKVGGFYMSIRGDNAEELLGISGTDAFDPASDNDPLSGTGETCWKSLRYWLNNKHGADFVCIDKGIQGYRTDVELTDEQAFTLCQTYETVLARLCRETELPIVMSEYYGLRENRAGRNLDPQFQGAQFALIYKYMLSGVRDRDYTALMWMESNNDEVCVFTDTAKTSGGQATPWYYTALGFKQYFCEGNVIIESSAASDAIQVMASQKKVMLVNVTTEPQVVKYGGAYHQLDGYEVLFVDTV